VEVAARTEPAAANLHPPPPPAAGVSGGPLASSPPPDYLDVEMNTQPPDPRASEEEEDTAAALKLWVVLSRAHRAVAEQARRDNERHGLHPTEFGVLEALYHKGPLLVGEVGSRILLTSGSTTHVIDKLEQRGLVSRRPCPTDRRALHVELTEEGRALIGGVFPEHARVIRRVTGGLTTEEKRIAAALLKRLGRFARDGA
jgi:MarR family transcriptional regulator, 2-MHQ and catechol-resistance regulon repressor